MNAASMNMFMSLYVYVYMHVWAFMYKYVYMSGWALLRMFRGTTSLTWEVAIKYNE